MFLDPINCLLNEKRTGIQTWGWKGAALFFPVCTPETSLDLPEMLNRFLTALTMAPDLLLPPASLPDWYACVEELWVRLGQLNSLGAGQGTWWEEQGWGMM